MLHGLSWSLCPFGTPVPHVTVTYKRPSLLGASLLVRSGFLGDLVRSACQHFCVVHLPKSVVCCSVTKFCLTLRDPTDGNMPGFPILHCLPEFAQMYVHRVADAIQPSPPLSFPSPAPSLSQHQSFPMSQLFPSGHQSIGASASASVLSMNIPGRSPLG